MNDLAMTRVPRGFAARLRTTLHGRRGAAAAVLLALAAPLPAASRRSAPVLTILHDFRLLASAPQAGLVADGSGNLYGTTAEGGDGGGGVVFTIREDGSGFAVLHHFGRVPGDGEAPVATLTLDASSGTLYGTTLIGGVSGFGTVFRVGTDGSDYDVLHSFTGEDDDGSGPYGTLLLDSGVLYGTASYGGPSGRGIVWRMAADGSGFAILHGFTGGSDGGNPSAGVVPDSSGNVYGTAAQFGSGHYGTVFRLKKDGSGFAVLHAFMSGASDGAGPDTTLARDSAGNLYGTTRGGGPGDWGTVYRLKPDGSGFQVLRTFSHASPDGASPAGPVALDGSGNLYGTTFFGGTDDHGVLFRMKTDGSAFSAVKRFDAASEGAFPTGSLLLDGATIRATTFQGGSGGVGTLYAVQTSGSGFSLLHTFGVGIIDGADPRAAMVLGSDGTLYGTTCDGQPGGHGTAFRIRPDGSGFAVLHGFPFDAPDGEDPSAPLLRDASGNLFGTAYDGGANAVGTLFGLGSDGAGFRVLRGFTNQTADGSYPLGALVADGSGYLYGTTSQGGPESAGTVFRIRPDGSGFTILHAFGGGSADGSYPAAAITLDGAGNIFGTTQGGGAAGVGTVFRMKTGGTGFAVIHSFRVDPAEGDFPQASLVLDPGGNLYGTTSRGGGPADAGTVFRVKSDGSGYAVLHKFSDDPDGADPRASLALDGAGNLYGTTRGGGPRGQGTIFTLKTDGSGYQVLHEFRGGPLDAAFPYGAVVLDAGGNLYGTTAEGGAWFEGTVFKLSPGTGTPRVIPVFPPPAVPVERSSGD